MVILLVDWCNITSFEFCGNTLFSIESLNCLCKTLAKTLEDYFKTLGGMLLLVVAFLGLIFMIFFLYHLSQLF